MNLDALATPGGQLAGMYLIMVLGCCLFPMSPELSKTLIYGALGAILRDMQNSRGATPKQ